MKRAHEKHTDSHNFGRAEALEKFFGLINNGDHLGRFEANFIEDYRLYYRFPLSLQRV